MSGIGGSDIAALLGLSPWKTPLQLWMDKTGRSTEQPDEAALERMHFGTVLEDVVAREYSARTGVKVQRINQQLAHPECSIALANIDRAILEDGKRARWSDTDRRVLGASGLLECKTAHALAQNSAEWGDAGTDEVPQHYWMQCQWYMGISGLPVADLSVLFGGQRFAIYTIAHDADVFADMLTEADAWWKRHVVADMPPPATTEDDARRLWKSHASGKTKIASATVADAIQQYAETKSEIRALEKEAQELRDIIACEFEDAEEITYMGKKLATWRQNKSGSKTDWHAVAKEAGATAELIQKHTETTEGARVLRIATIKE